MNFVLCDVAVIWLFDFLKQYVNHYNIITLKLALYGTSLQSVKIRESGIVFKKILRLIDNYGLKSVFGLP